VGARWGRLWKLDVPVLGSLIRPVT
jgi:hypothetical protein